MTVNDRSIPEDVYQSFSQLRDFVDGFSFLADMIPEGKLIFLITNRLAIYFVLFPVRFMPVLMFTGVLSSMLNLSNAKSGVPLGFRFSD